MAKIDADTRVARERTMASLLAIWQGEADPEDLDEIVTGDFVGHLGFRTRDRERLKRDIAAFRASADNVRFALEHRFMDGEFVATRWSASARDREGKPLVAAGLNISRWTGDRLAEEWAVWEPLHAPDLT